MIREMQEAAVPVAGEPERRREFQEALKAIGIAGHVQYVLHFLDTGNKSLSAKKAGYDHSGTRATARRIHRRPEVQVAIALGLELKTGAMADEVFKIDVERLDKQMQDIVDDPEAKDADRISAAKLLYRRADAFEEERKRLPDPGKPAPKIEVHVYPDSDVEWIEDAQGRRVPKPQGPLIEHEPR